MTFESETYTKCGLKRFHSALQNSNRNSAIFLLFLSICNQAVKSQQTNLLLRRLYIYHRNRPSILHNSGTATVKRIHAQISKTLCNDQMQRKFELTL